MDEGVGLEEVTFGERENDPGPLRRLFTSEEGKWSRGLILCLVIGIALDFVGSWMLWFGLAPALLFWKVGLLFWIFGFIVHARANDLEINEIF